MRLARAIGFLVVFVAVSACDDPTGPTVQLNEEFTLSPGEVATVSGTGIRIRFVGVEGDSRCPADVICIQGGDAIVRIEVLSLGGGAQSYELHTAGTVPVVHGNMTIALVQLSPFPFSSRTIQPEEYRATLRVTGSP
jgi:hypothetical protein